MEGQMDAMWGRTGWRSIRLAGSFPLDIECRVAGKLIQFSGLLAEKMCIDEVVIEALMPKSVSLVFIYKLICELIPSDIAMLIPPDLKARKGTI
jgi:hypothetical protein